MNKIIVCDGVTELTFLYDYRHSDSLIVASRPVDSSDIVWTSLPKSSLIHFLCDNFKMFDYAK